jgi:MYXO-CTERM domain-containing protein
VIALAGIALTTTSGSAAVVFDFESASQQDGATVESFSGFDSASTSILTDSGNNFRRFNGTGGNGSATATFRLELDGRYDVSQATAGNTTIDWRVNTVQTRQWVVRFVDSSTGNTVVSGGEFIPSSSSSFSTFTFGSIPDSGADDVDALEFFIERRGTGGNQQIRADFDNFESDATLVPTPSSLALGLAGLAGLAMMRRRRS